MQSAALSPMKKPRRKRFRSTPKSLKRNSVGKSKFATARPNQTRPRESRPQIAIFQKRWRLENQKKPQVGGKRSRTTSTTLNTSNASSVAASSATSSAASPSTSRNKRTRRAPDYFGFESSVCSVSDDSAAPAHKKQKPENPVIATVLQEEAAQPPAPATYYELQVVSPPAPPPVGTWSPESYDYEEYTRK